MWPDGQYAFIERLGKGSFGVVNKYLDLKSRKIVAGKHIEDPKKLDMNEVESLMRARKQGSSRHLVFYLDSFYDGDIPGNYCTQGGIPVDCQ